MTPIPPNRAPRLNQGIEEEVWIHLAELFFLDTEPTEECFARVANLLNQNLWTKERVEKTLVQLIAPHVAANLGNLVMPTIGEWARFDRESLCRKIQNSKELREQNPEWYFLLSDWWHRRMLNQLGLARLLNQVEK